MERNLNDIFFACSYALDCVERELVGVTTNHGKRVAYICLKLAKDFGMSEEERSELAGCAILHDSALTQFLKEEKDKGIVIEKNLITEEQLKSHCILGEENIKKLPFRTDVKNVILYHHENADGTGVFGKTAKETPLKAQLVHIADIIDVTWHLDSISESKYERLLEWLNAQTDKMFSKECVEKFTDVFSYENIRGMSDSEIDRLLKTEMPENGSLYTDQDLYDVASLFAKIIDYKSNFTSLHSIGIAQKAAIMSKYYEYDDNKIAKMYFAGALHDIGKLVIVSGVLEKPDKLTAEEYKHIQNHAYASYDILKRIQGMEDITEWAAFHHEKLDGSGYPFNKKAEDLSWESRIMACLDIYQALTEDRPYKKGLDHKKTIEILNTMVAKNQLDGAVVKDIDKIFGDF